jgi:hypothetical protein
MTPLNKPRRPATAAMERELIQDLPEVGYVRHIVGAAR